jgi:hypothetical protein
LVDETAGELSGILGLLWESYRVVRFDESRMEACFIKPLVSESVVERLRNGQGAVICLPAFQIAHVCTSCWPDEETPGWRRVHFEVQGVRLRPLL